MAVTRRRRIWCIQTNAVREELQAPSSDGEQACGRRAVVSVQLTLAATYKSDLADPGVAIDFARTHLPGARQSRSLGDTAPLRGGVTGTFNYYRRFEVTP